jgi:hypothetical protein
MTDSGVSWRLEDKAAFLTCGPLTGNLALDDSWGGIKGLGWKGKHLESFEVLRFSFPSFAPDTHVTDAYIRGADLVVSRSQSDKCAIAPHFYYQLQYLPAFDAARIALVISVNTNLLNGRPDAAVRSVASDVRMFYLSRSYHYQLSPTEFQEETTYRWLRREQSSLNVVVLRHERIGVSYVEIVHPSDFESMQFRHSMLERGTLSLIFQKEHLEKGVIRRARVCGWFLPAQNDLAVAVELARQFIDEPLPLTT